MQFIPDYSDERVKDYCVYCKALLAGQELSKEHVPSKVFLVKPYPENLFVVWICRDCNNSFSSDEEYTAAILGVMMSGSPDPENQIWDSAKRILSHQNKLREQIEKGCKIDAEGRFFGINFNENRIENVLAKNAKALALYMISEPLYDEPSHISWRFLTELTEEEKQQFEHIPAPTLFPEVGSRMMILQNTEGELIGHWTEIQKNSFRFALMWDGPIKVRMVFQEFLFAEVVWEG